MSHELNFTYKCPNSKHNKTARRNRHEPQPVCPICGKQMEIIRTPMRFQCERIETNFKRCKRKLNLI